MSGVLKEQWTIDERVWKSFCQTRVFHFLSFFLRRSPAGKEGSMETKRKKINSGFMLHQVLRLGDSPRGPRRFLLIVCGFFLGHSKRMKRRVKEEAVAPTKSTGKEWGFHRWDSGRKGQPQGGSFHKGKKKRFCRKCGSVAFLTQEKWVQVITPVIKKSADPSFQSSFSERRNWVRTSIGQMCLFHAEKNVRGIDT